MRVSHQKSTHILKLTTFAIFICGSLIINGRISADADRFDKAKERVPPIPTEPFSPSNARTEDGNLIPVEQFFPASRCASCHQDTHRFWSQSLHRNAAREPFYRESADILLRTRGIEFTRHCESCHTPVALFSGQLTKGAGKNEAPFTPLDHEGVTCSVCHSITEARLDGTGSFTIRRPALMATEDGTPVFGDFTDQQILADIPGHKRAVMRPLLKQPEFCSTCHKVDAPPSLNGYKHIRGFSAYDEWQQSGASHESVIPFYRREERTDCRACHMPKVSSAIDRAAKNGVIASHRWLGANTAVPLFYEEKNQVEATVQFLKQGVIEVDLFSVRRAATGEMIPLDALRNRVAINAGDELIVEVVVSNRNAAHTFPPEVRDLYETWVEFEAVDSSGRRMIHSGFVKPDGMLDESAHVYKQIILDEQGRHITRHQIWTTNIKAYDNALPPGRSDIVRYSFRLPSDMRPNQPLTLRARMNYRRFNQEYSNYVLNRQKRQMVTPIVQMAVAEVKVGMQDRVNGPMKTTPPWKRWNDYGIGLLEQSQYGAASAAFRKAAELNPTDSNLLVNIAIAEMGTERFGAEMEQFKKAELMLDAALKIDSENYRARFYRAQVWRACGRVREAVDELEQIARVYPRDREVQRQLGQTLFALAQLPRARLAFESVLQIDPTDFSAWQFLASIYAGESRASDSKRANAMYLQWRDDPVADSISARFYQAHPEWAEERIRSHIHGRNSAGRPVLIGHQATPDK
jgi:tetratricopeptide (TPR) repeat protein